MKKMILFLISILSINFADPIVTPETTWDDLRNLGILEEFEDVFYIYHPKDVISYTRHLFEETYLNKLKSTYHGCEDLSFLDQLVEKQDYIEVLNHIWTEKNYTKRIQWLEKKAKGNHPILMLELAYAYFLESPTLHTYVTKFLPWLRISKIRIEMDASCTSDRSVGSASAVVENYERLITGNLLNRFSIQEIESYYVEHAEDQFLNLYKIGRLILEPFITEEKANFPSPRWVFFHGVHTFIDTPNEISETEWDKIRECSSFYRLENIYAQENECRHNYRGWLEFVRQFAENFGEKNP